MTVLPRAAVLLALLLASFLVLAEDRPIPPLTGRVVDETGTLTAQQKSALEAKLQEFETRKGSQIAVLITGTTFPEPIEAYSIRVAEAWKIGRKGVNDGILIVVAKSDRAMRLEVGYGLEGVVPDAMARRLIDEVFTPGFREGQFYEGLNAGIDRLMKVIDGEPLPEPSTSNAGKGSPRSLESYFVVLVVATLAIGGILRSLFGRLPGAVLAGAGVGFLAWLIIAPVLVAALAGVVAFFVTLLGGGMGRIGGGGFGGGGFGGGGFGGGGFGGGGGGGFSGGGGGFGGGGASGKW
ncbi:MAG TPA: TPM domain-containing protein [Burkholderiales bacterium]|nr:TPM domain-containing protein [Burkholderiales bacterium]